MAGNNYYYGNGVYNGMGPVGNMFNAPAEPIKMDNLLDKEDFTLLAQENKKRFVTPISKSELAATKCTHKKDGHFTIQPTGAGTYRCTICGEEFEMENPNEVDITEIKDDCEKVLNHLQTIKTFFTDMTIDDIRLFQCIPIIKRIPQMYEATRATYNKLDMFSANPYLSGNGLGYTTSAQMMDAVTTGRPMMPGYAAAPMYYAPAYGTPMAGYTEPAGYPTTGYPAPGYPTAPAGYPTAPAAGYPAPAAPAADASQNSMPYNGNANFQNQNNANTQYNNRVPAAAQYSQPNNGVYVPTPPAAATFTGRDPSQPNPGYSQAPNPIGTVVAPNTTTHNVTVNTPDEAPSIVMKG